MKPSTIRRIPLKDFLNTARDLRNKEPALYDANIVLDTCAVTTHIDRSARKIIKHEQIRINEYTLYELELLSQFPEGLFYKKSVQLLNLAYDDFITVDKGLNTTLTQYNSKLNGFIFVVPDRLKAIEYLESIFYSDSAVIFPDEDGINLTYCILRNDLKHRKQFILSMKNSAGNINENSASPITYSSEGEVSVANKKHRYYARGGESTLFIRNDTILKLYNYKTNNLKAEKISLLIKEGKKPSGINSHVMFPQKLVDYKSNCGYTMEKAEGVTLTKALKDRFYMKIITEKANEIFKHILYIVLELNMRGIVLSDISSDNVMLNEFGEVFFCDIDSAQVSHNNLYYASGCFRPKASSQKIAKLSIKTPDRLPSYIRTQENDAFSLTVLLYEIYMGGCSPLHATGELGLANFHENTFPLNYYTTSCYGVPASVLNRWMNLDLESRIFFVDTFSAKIKPCIGMLIKYVFGRTS